MHRLSSFGLVFPALLLGLFWPLRSSAALLVWLEGEKPASINLPVREEGVGKPQFLSEARWLKVSVEADKVEQEVPAEGVVLRYPFSVSAPGEYQLWNRIGYEFARSIFEWRLNGGAWTHVSPEELTIDLMELSLWTEVAWLKLGTRTLASGSHTLEIRLPKARDEQGKFKRILYASDALCVSAQEFHPNGKFKPGEDWREPSDRAAAEGVFILPGQSSGNQSVELKGQWEICRHDEQLPGAVAEPIRDLPAQPFWRGIAVPGDKNTLRPDLLFAHRVWYRTRVFVPGSYAGQSFYLDFPQNNLNTTVYANGRLCGFNPNPFARFQIDVTRGIQAGATNEIRVGIRDAWYAYSSHPNNPLKLRKKFNLPVRFFDAGFQDLAYPIWAHAQSGILVTPRFVAAGAAYVADVFCKPSVSRKELALEVTLKNPSATGCSGELLCEAVSDGTGAVEKTFRPRVFSLAGGSEQLLQLTEAWPTPKLWWPDEPRLYRLRTTVRSVAADVARVTAPPGTDSRPTAAATTDIRETLFGFREWGAQGKHFTLNGVIWHGWADCFTAPNSEEWLKFYRQKNQATMRFWGTRWMGLPPEEALDFFDRHGVVVRRSGLLDGQRIGHMAIENDPDLKKLYGSEIKIELMRQWQNQMIAQVRGERNHPSINVWSLENEWLYINCLNLYGGKMDEFEREVKKVSDAVLAVDPTRLTMTDGGGANQDQSMPVHGNHYVWDSQMTRYPDLAYEANPTGGGRGRWVWDEHRPRFLGEDYFIAGHHPELAYLGGEAVFTGKAGSLPAAGLMARLLTEGYRWAEFGAFHFWMGQNDTDGQLYKSFAPRAVFCREWDWTFASGEKVRRTFGLFNDTHSDEPIRFTWELSIGTQRHAGDSSEHPIAPGTNRKILVTIPMPIVATRTEAALALTLAVRGQPVFRDVKWVSLLPLAKLRGW